MTKRKDRSNGRMTEEEIRQLDALGMAWNAVSAKWERGYAEAAVYYDQDADLEFRAEIYYREWLEAGCVDLLSERCLPERVAEYRADPPVGADRHELGRTELPPLDGAISCGRTLLSGAWRFGMFQQIM